MPEGYEKDEAVSTDKFTVMKGGFRGKSSRGGRGGFHGNIGERKPSSEVDVEMDRNIGSTPSDSSR